MSERPISFQTPLCNFSNKQKAPKIKKSKYSKNFYVIRNDEKPLWKLLKQKRDRPKLCDVTLTVGDRHLYAHKDVLMANIPYFKAMFESGMKETKSNQIEIKEIDFECLKMVIDYVYGKEIKLTAETFMPLAVAAHFYQVPNLTGKCMKTFPRVFTKNFDVNHLLPLHSFCRLIDETEHIGPIEYAIKDNFEAVSMHPDFPNLPFETILKFCKADALTVKDEEVVLQAICRWLNRNPYQKLYAKDLLECVRFPLLETSTLKSLADSDEHKHCELIQMMIDRAIEVKENKFTIYKRDSNFHENRAREPIGTTIIFPSSGLSNSRNDFFLYSISDGFWTKTKYFLEDVSIEIVFMSGEQICWYDRKIHKFVCRSFTSSLLKVHQKRANYSPARFNRFVKGNNAPKAISNGKSWIFGNVHKRTLVLWKGNSTLCTRIEGAKYGAMLVYLDEAIYIIGGKSAGPGSTPLDDVLMVKAEDISVKKEVQPVQMASMIHARDYPSAVVFKGKIYVYGRNLLPVFRDSIEVYDPQKNEWKLFAYPFIKNLLVLSATKSNMYALTRFEQTRYKRVLFERFDEIEQKWHTQKIISQKKTKKEKKKNYSLPQVIN